MAPRKIMGNRGAIGWACLMGSKWLRDLLQSIRRHKGFLCAL